MKKLIEKSLTAKISLAISVVLIFFISLITYLDASNEDKDILGIYRMNASALVSTIEKAFISAMREGRSEDVQKIFENIGTQEGVIGVRIFDEKGSILRSNNKAEIGGTVDGETLREYKGLIGSENSSVNGLREFSFIKPLYNGPQCFGCHPASGRVNGILNVRISMDRAYEEIDRNRLFMFKWGLLAILCVGLSQIMLLRTTVVKPAGRLRAAMLKAEAGEDFRIEVYSEDEIGELGRAFNRMMERIKELGLEAIKKENEIVRQQDELKSQTLLASVIKAMPDGVAILGRDMRLQLVNPGYRKLFPHVEAGDICYECIHKRDSVCPHCGVKKVFEDGSIHEHESSATMPDGTVKIVHSISGPIVGEGGVIRSAIEVLRDVTDRVRLEKEFQEKSWELERANKKLAQMAVTDGLTRLFNHKFFQDSLKREFRRLARHKTMPFLSLAMLDIDNFKAFNDTYGHQAGDAVLKGIADVLRDSVRITDTVARYGGEEFVILMPETNVEGTGVVADRIRKNVEEFEFMYNNERLKVTVSVGLASYPQEGITNEDDLLKAADLALYKAKELGRNRVVVSKGLNS